MSRRLQLHLLILIFLLFSCSRKPNQNFLIQLVDSSKTSLTFQLQDNFEVLSTPSNLSEIDCLGVVLSYPDLSSANSCEVTNGESLPVDLSKGLISYNTALENGIKVSGIKSTLRARVDIIGLNNNDSATCTGFGPELTVGNDNYSSAYYLGGDVGQSPVSEENSYLVELSFDASKSISSCPSSMWTVEDTSTSLADDLAAYFDFDNYTTNGTSFFDSNNTFTWSDPGDVIPLASAQIGRGLAWNATGHLTSTSGAASIFHFTSASDVKTISFWYKYTSGTPPVSMVFGVHDTVNKGYSVGFGATGKLAFHYGNASTPSTDECSSASCDVSSANNNWVFYTVVIDLPNTAIKFYVDGTLIESGGLGAILSNINNTSTGASIGRDITGSNLSIPFGSQVDTIGVWDRELSADEINTLYNGGSGMNRSQVLAAD